MKNKILIEAISNEQYLDAKLTIPSHNEERKTIPTGITFDKVHFLELNSGLIEALKVQIEALSNTFRILRLQMKRNWNFHWDLREAVIFAYYP